MSALSTGTMAQAKCGPNNYIEGRGPQESDTHLHSVNQAFDIDHVRTKILKYAIFSKYSGLTVDQGTVQSCRLVHPKWTHSISSILRSCRIPLLYLRFGDNLQENSRKLLDYCIGSTSNPRSKSYPLGLHLWSHYFVPNNSPHLSSLFGACGENLVKLDMFLHNDAGSMISSLPVEVKFPILQEVKVALLEDVALVDANNQSNPNGLLFLLQNIFDRCRKLKTFRLSIIFQKQADIRPVKLGNLVLPKTLTSLELSCKLSGEDLRILINNPLPRLKTLTIMPEEVRWDSGTVFGILQNVRKTLESFSVDGLSSSCHCPGLPTFYSFPQMKRLRCFHLGRTDWKLNNAIGPLEHCLSKLKTLSLQAISEVELRRWTVGRRYFSIRNLRVYLVNPAVFLDSPNYFQSVKPEMMMTLKHAFPNVVALTISVAGDDTSGLRAVFREMKQLEWLRVEVRHSENILSYAPWDYLLIGNSSAGDSASIKNLTALYGLVLTTVGSPVNLQSGSLISDATFTLALMKMNKLLSLWLGGRFHIAPQMKRKWTEELKRQISYSVDGGNVCLELI